MKNKAISNHEAINTANLETQPCTAVLDDNSHVIGFYYLVPASVPRSLKSEGCLLQQAVRCFKRTGETDLFDTVEDAKEWLITLPLV